MCYARHLGRGSWVFMDGHTTPLTFIQNEENRCELWVANKTEHRKQYGGGN